MGRIVIPDWQAASFPICLNHLIEMKLLPVWLGAAALNSAGAGEFRFNSAKDNSDTGDLSQRLKLRCPKLMLERSLRNQRDAMGEQEFHRVEKCLIDFPAGIAGCVWNCPYRI